MPDMEKVIKGLQELHGSRETMELISDAIVLLKEQNNCENCAMAIEDRQPVVRCKDCIHWDKERTEECDNSDSVCFHNGWCKPDWFFAYGERKEGR